MERVRKHYRKVRMERKNWIRNRSFSKVADRIKEAAGVDLGDFLLQTAGRKRRPLRILDDGAGDGLLLRDIKQFFAKPQNSM
jgi:hypothetical protein